MNDEIMLRMNEDGSFGLYEPFANIECETEEDFAHLCEMVKLGESIVRCKDCKFLVVYNSPTLYAYCNKNHLRFEPFAKDRDTREFFCACGERREDHETD